jgi:hypothetical protein
MSSKLGALLACLLPLLLAQPSFAQSSSDIERAKASFKSGANAYAAGDYLAAIQALETAYELSPLPAIAFSLAQAERKQYFVKQEREHLERALLLFRRYVEQEPRGPRREDALSAIASLEPLLGSKPAHPGSEPRPQQRPTRVMIVSTAPGARISLDGSSPAASPLIREVAPGKHRARISASGYFEVEREVMAVAGELLLTEVELNERPSTLYVWAPEGADVYIDGMHVGQGGPRLALPLMAGRHQLTVGQKGKRLVRREVEVVRGKVNSEVVRLEPTVQRNLSELLFIGGGAGVGAAIALSAFAVRSENRAEDFLRWRDAGPSGPSAEQVGSAELLAYNVALIERNRFRTAATISVAASAGMFITGLFLHEMDRPSVQHEPSRGRSLRASSLSLSAAPSAADVGASLQLNF